MAFPTAWQSYSFPLRGPLAIEYRYIYEERGGGVERLCTAVAKNTKKQQSVESESEKLLEAKRAADAGGLSFTLNTVSRYIKVKNKTSLAI